MEAGFEAAKGAAEKVLGVKLPIFMRVILPGLLATGVLYPSVAWILGALPSDADHMWLRIAAYAVLVVLSGALISTTNSEIYKIYEGRSWWPPRLSEWARRRQQARVERLLKSAESPTSQAAYNEIWSELRSYPIDDDGQPEATHPTLMGNILAGYEQYPDTRYGMDSVFYWPRIWLQIDKDKKEEIDSQWSVADGFLTLSAISFVGSVLWTVQAVAAEFNAGAARLPLGAPGRAVLGGAGWLLLGFLWYKLSLPFHRENGEVYKSIFDVYRDKVWPLTSLKPGEKETWGATWAYLQYLRLKCPNCDGWNNAGSDKCSKCGFGLLELNRNLRDSGKFKS
jgi:hypothetical protein